MAKNKFRISIIDFLLENGKHEVGKDGTGEKVCLGDMVRYNDEDNWFVVYRYGNVMIKQIGMMAMIGLTGFKEGDFSRIEKLKNNIGAGMDWLIIGYTDEPIYDRVKDIEGVELIEVPE
jgi:hypothetical protein